MKSKSPRVLSAAAFMLIAGTGLSACSKPAGEKATSEPAATATATAEAPAGEQGGGQDVSSQNARGLLKAMSDYMAAQQSISMSYDSVFEVVSADKEKLQVATSGTVDLTRPDKLHSTRKSGFSDTEMWFDGKTISFLGKSQNAYIQAESPGTIDQLIDALRDKFHRQLPGADLLGANVYDGLMTDVSDVKDLGSGVIGGQECDHLAFRAKDTDWQIWIAQGPAPRPCRYVITSKSVDHAPQFTMTIRDWKTGGAGNYAFAPPAGAKKLDPKDLQSLKDTADLPENYKMGAAG